MQLELCLGISIRSLRDTEMEESPLAQREPAAHLWAPLAYSAVTAVRFRTERKEGKQCQDVRCCGWRQVMQEGEFHCHVFPEEKGACKFVGAAYSIISRFHSWSQESQLHRCVVCFCLHTLENYPSPVFFLSILYSSTRLCSLDNTTRCW